MLLAGGEGILKPETIRRFTLPQGKDTFDQTFQHKMDWGLGFIVDSNHLGRETVPTASADTPPRQLLATADHNPPPPSPTPSTTSSSPSSATECPESLAITDASAISIQLSMRIWG